MKPKKDKFPKLKELKRPNGIVVKVPSIIHKGRKYYDLDAIRNKK